MYLKNVPREVGQKIVQIQVEIRNWMVTVPAMSK